MAEPITAEELGAALAQAGYGPGTLRKELYALPTREWVEQWFSPALRNLFVMFQVRYEDGVFNCVDISEFATVIARLAHLNTPGHPPGSEIAFGTVDFVTGDGPGHQRNLFVTREEGRLVVLEYEPQTLTVAPKEEGWLCVESRF